ncbi:MAG: hypothetical protein HC876_10535 [Chloroflexaceae bacterium]|nr:hypothetical protein [Chloroflexaceae bacterium]
MFERGRLAGLGEAPSGQWNALSWPRGSPPGPGLKLPVYYEWRFGTGIEGDFESLVRKIEPRTLPPTFGTRTLDVSAPGTGLPPASNYPLALRAALTGVGSSPTAWETAEKATFQSGLTALLNMSKRLKEADATADDVVTPPLYGQWHAAEDEVGTGPTWFDDVNLDPRHRIAAGAGTQVVQKEQRQLLASAWDQAGKTAEVNDMLRRAQMARWACITARGRPEVPEV